MREIKFRFYPKNQITNFQGKTLQKMWEATSIDFEENEISNGGDIFSLNEVELMQYTWYKDKNWKEIYEGDIVHTYDDNWDIENNWIPWLVLFKNCCFHIFDDYERLRDASAWHWSVLIIWNIYENPKLLTN